MFGPYATVDSLALAFSDFFNVLDGIIFLDVSDYALDRLRIIT